MRILGPCSIRLGVGAMVAALLVVMVGLPAAGSADDSEARKFFLHIGIEGGDVGPAEFRMNLSVDDYPERGSGSANVFDGAPNEAFILTGAREPVTTRFPTVDGTPFRLDAAKRITGLIALEAYRVNAIGTGVPVGGGLVTLDLDLAGELRTGEKVSVGHQRLEAVVTPAQDLYLLDVDIQPTPSLHRKTFSSLTLTTLVRGPSAMAGAFELDDPASFIEVPIVGR